MHVFIGIEGDYAKGAAVAGRMRWILRAKLSITPSYVNLRRPETGLHRPPYPWGVSTCVIGQGGFGQHVSISAAWEAHGEVVVTMGLGGVLHLQGRVAVPGLLLCSECGFPTFVALSLVRWWQTPAELRSSDAEHPSSCDRVV